MGAATSSTTFVDSNRQRRAPESDLYADVEELKNKVKVSSKAIESLEARNKYVEEQVIELKKERDEAKKEIENLSDLTDYYIETSSNANLQDQVEDDIEKVWAEKEDGQLVFFKLEDFFRHMKREIIAKAEDPKEKATQLWRLEQCRENAKRNRNYKMKTTAVIGGLAAGGLIPAVVVAGEFVATAAAVVQAGVLIGSFAVGGLVVGLVLLGGMYLYTKWCDEPPPAKKNQ